jgi:hypothetical protein
MRPSGVVMPMRRFEAEIQSGRILGQVAGEAAAFGLHFDQLENPGSRSRSGCRQVAHDVIAAEIDRDDSRHR